MGRKRTTERPGNTDGTLPCFHEHGVWISVRSGCSRPAPTSRWSPTERRDLLERAVEFDAVTAVDLELAALSGEGDHDAGRVADHAREHGASVVVSTHDFEATPDRAAIAHRLERACAYGDVGKMASTAQSADDVLAMLGATRELTAAGETVATMCMGEAGRHSRAVAPLYGSRIGYAPVDPADATAPGQYDLATLRTLVGQLQSDA